MGMQWYHCWERDQTYRYSLDYTAYGDTWLFLVTIAHVRKEALTTGALVPDQQRLCSRFTQVMTALFAAMTTRALPHRRSSLAPPARPAANVTAKEQHSL